MVHCVHWISLIVRFSDSAMSILSAEKKKITFTLTIPKGYVINIFSTATQTCKFCQAGSKPRGNQKRKNQQLFQLNDKWTWLLAGSFPVNRVPLFHKMRSLEVES